MTQIALSLTPTVFEKKNYDGTLCTMRTMTFDVAGLDLLSKFRRLAEIKRATDLKEVVDHFAAKAREAVPDESYAISVRVTRGERKPPGFDKLVDDRTDPLGLDRFVKTIEEKSN